VKYTRFEELPAWNAAIELAVGIYKLTSDRSLLKQRAFRDQLERASVSVSNNIAEGFERGTTQELLTFLYIARGSAGEVRSMLCLLERLLHSADLKSETRDLKSVSGNLQSEISNLKSLAEGVSRQLRGWADSLQGSAIKGQRYLTPKVRQTEQARRGREQLLEELRQVQKGA
jgi:four helix bundle protein